jgi:hypothetical protein
MTEKPSHERIGEIACEVSDLAEQATAAVAAGDESHPGLVQDLLTATLALFRAQENLQGWPE